MTKRVGYTEIIAPTSEQITDLERRLKSGELLRVVFKNDGAGNVASAHFRRNHRYEPAIFASTGIPTTEGDVTAQEVRPDLSNEQPERDVAPDDLKTGVYFLPVERGAPRRTLSADGRRLEGMESLTLPNGHPNFSVFYGSFADAVTETHRLQALHAEEKAFSVQKDPDYSDEEIEEQREEVEQGIVRQEKIDATPAWRPTTLDFIRALAVGLILGLIIGLITHHTGDL